MAAVELWLTMSAILTSFKADLRIETPDSLARP
jgi:hypothetical protein